MAATADPRAKPPTAHHLKPWVPTPTPRAHRVPSLPAVSGGSGGAKPARDRRRSSSSSFHRRRSGTATDAGAVDEEEEEEVEVVEGFDSGLEDLRAKLMGHIKDVADRFHLPQPKSQPRSPDPEPPAPPLPPPPPPPSDTSAATAARPWNLRERKRRSSARGSTAASPTTAWAARRAETARGGGERAPFAVALTAEEIEEDIYALTGGRPRRRPRKRPRVVQRQLDSLFPGLWLTEITADAYKVPDD